MKTDDTLLAQATQAGFDSFMATFGRVSDRFKVLQEYAPGAFAGYGLMRNTLMQERPAYKRALEVGGSYDMRRLMPENQ